MKRKIGDIAIEVMQEEDSPAIGYETYGMLDEVFFRAKREGFLKERGSRDGRARPHPLNRQMQVLNAIDRDARFEKKLMRCTNGRAEVLVRIFYLKAIR